MSTQPPLFPEPAAPQRSGEPPRPAATWVLDEETRAIGQRRAAEARAILRAHRAGADLPSRRRADAQSAA